MAVELFIHKMTEHMDRARILRWLVQEGDTVELGQAVMEVETEKAVVELEAPAPGVIKGIRPGALDGVEVAVGETLAFIAAADEAVPSLAPIGGKAAEVAPVAARSTAGVAEPGSTRNGRDGGPVRATPLARRTAKDLGIDLGHVIGSGPGGAIRQQDVRAYVADASTRAELQAPAVDVAVSHVMVRTPGRNQASSESRGLASEVAARLELNAIQRLTGQRMLESVRAAPQFALDIRVNMSGVQALREAHAHAGQDPPSVTACLVGVTAEALRRHPRLNSTFADGCLQTHPQANIGVAIGTVDGLVVPVIHNAGTLSLEEIAARIRDLQGKSVTMRFSLEDMSGGTFTISNLGMFGVERFNAILNPSQSAILAVGSIAKTPIALSDDAVAIRPIATLTLTVDHRAVDGFQAARFLEFLRKLIEDPSFLM